MQKHVFPQRSPQAWMPNVPVPLGVRLGRFGLQEPLGPRKMGRSMQHERTHAFRRGGFVVPSKKDL